MITPKVLSHSNPDYNYRKWSFLPFKLVCDLTAHTFSTHPNLDWAWYSPVLPFHPALNYVWLQEVIKSQRSVRQTNTGRYVSIEIDHQKASRLVEGAHHLSICQLQTGNKCLVQLKFKRQISSWIVSSIYILLSAYMHRMYRCARYKDGHFINFNFQFTMNEELLYRKFSWQYFPIIPYIKTYLINFNYL